MLQINILCSSLGGIDVQYTLDSQYAFPVAIRHKHNRKKSQFDPESFHPVV